MNSRYESSLKIDQLSNELSELMLCASGVLRHCEAKLVEFKGCGDLRVGGEIHRLASELDAMFTGVGAQYRLAQKKARVARSLLDSLMDGVHRGDDRDVDEEVFLSTCLSTDRSLKSFSLLLVELEQQMKASVNTLNRAAAERLRVSSDAGAFDRFMHLVTATKPISGA